MRQLEDLNLDAVGAPPLVFIIASSGVQEGAKTPTGAATLKLSEVLENDFRDNKGVLRKQDR